MDLKDLIAKMDQIEQQPVQLNEDKEALYNTDTFKEEVRMTNINPKDYESKGLNLVGNTVAATGKEKDENDVPGAKKFDESRIEIKQVQNIIRNADKIEAIVNKLDVPEGTKTDITNLVKWMQKDLEEVRNWIHSNKKENKRGR
jgi:hypothetical protein